MLILLYGSDTYRRGQALEMIREQFKTKHSKAELAHISLGAEEGVEALKDFLGGGSLFDLKKFGVVEGIEVWSGKKAEETKTIKALLKEAGAHPHITIVVLADKKPAKEFAFLTTKKYTQKEFAPLKEEGSKAFIKREAERRGIKLRPELFKELLDAYPDNSWAIITELEMLALGKELPAQKEEVNFFAALQTLKRSSVEKKLRALHLLLSQYDPVASFNVLAAIADPSLKTRMANYDIAVKQGKLEYLEILLDLALT